MSRIVPISQRNAGVEKPVEDLVFEHTLALVRSLLSSMPDDQKHRIARELLAITATESAPKAGDVLATVLHLVKRKQNFTVSELKDEVDRYGVNAQPKEIYNAIGYLTRTGKLRRVGYGKYLVDGVEIRTSDELGGEDLRQDDEYRTTRP